MSNRTRLLYFADEIFQLGRDFQMVAKNQTEGSKQLSMDRFNDLKIKLISEADRD